ncbi:hypothetical protein BDN72DRAFT_961333 [Pluteus cervinus]|uniref:Uncharacterized protein n=1 Tax=Pluteus cervinus TaxID=181527 RepID=A0ACD3ANW3_9AGAR|nr:hypothetical protein BDN72DRAFT_961333 [Pluteus cervinus]
MNEGFIAQSHLSNNRNDEARQEIDEEITLLEKHLLGLRAARNALAPIYDLPTEVMTTIFLLVFYSSTPKGHLSLVLSWVSQRWREIALGIPTLWTVVDTVKVDIPSYITRSHHNPLSFILPKLNAERMYCVPQVLKEQERIEHLDLRLHWRIEEEQVAFFKEFCNPIPVMKTLTLFGFRIPAPPFHQLAPCLTHLTLYECATHWPTFPSCPELTSLTITTPSTSMPIDHCLNVLQLAPKLRTLNLREALHTTIFGPLVPVDLLDLQDLSISGERGDVLVVLLQNLVFAKVTSVVIKASHNSEPIQSAILEKVQIAIDSPNKPITSLHVATNINDGFHQGNFFILIDDNLNIFW